MTPSERDRRHALVLRAIRELTDETTEQVQPSTERDCAKCEWHTQPEIRAKLAQSGVTIARSSLWYTLQALSSRLCGHLEERFCDDDGRYRKRITEAGEAWLAEWEGGNGTGSI